MSHDPEKRRDVAAQFAEAVRKLHRQEGRGPLAELWRLRVDSPAAPVFWRMTLTIDPAAGEKMIPRYARLARMLALCPELDGRRRAIGPVLHAANVSEARVQKLLAARGPALDYAIITLARRLAHAGRLPWRELADLILHRDESPAAERARMDIARAYWAPARSADQTAEETTR